MIYDKLSNAKRYLGFSPNLDAALRYIAEHDLNELPLGKTSILDDQVYIMVSMLQPGSADEISYEIHDLYIDIQLDIFGTERIDIGNRSHMEILEENKKNDLTFVKCDTLVECTMGPGNFLIIMPEEPHKPGIISSKNSTIKKCVVKVHI